MPEDSLLHGDLPRTRAEAMASGAPGYFTGQPCKSGHISVRHRQGNCLACDLRNKRAKRAAGLVPSRRITTGDWYARTAAKQDGRPTYETGRPCKNGHIVSRETVNGACRRCNADASARQRLANPEKNRENAKRWREAFPEKFKTGCLSYRLRNPEVFRVANENRRARKRNAPGEGVSRAEFAAILKRQKFKCAWCKTSIKDKAEQDHVIPLSKGGAHSVANVVGSCPPCNRRKKDMLPEEFARRLGLLI